MRAPLRFRPTLDRVEARIVLDSTIPLVPAPGVPVIGPMPGDPGPTPNPVFLVVNNVTCSYQLVSV